jgi:RluA family pseudouridine synthase
MKLSCDNRTLITTATPDDAGKRLDVVARKAFAFLPLAAIFQGIRKGRIQIDGKRVKETYRLQAGDRLSYRSPTLLSRQDFEPEPAIATALDPVLEKSYRSLEILWESADLLIVNKPIGWISHGDAPSLSHWLQWHYGTSASISFAMSPVHRLDVGTSGAITLSKSVLGARVFTEQQSNHQITKRYLAIVCGSGVNSGAVTVHLVRQDKKSYAYATNQATSKLATTQIRLLSSHGSYSLIECLLIGSGRTHQIRATCSYLGHSVLGDKLYGGTSDTQYYLHCKGIADTQGALGFETIEATLPENFTKKLSELGLKIKI